MSSESKPYIGGQAVIEGVMMRSPASLSVAVRRPDGSIAVRDGGLVRGPRTASLARWPLLRGVATLVEALSLGFSALQFSVDQQMTEQERKEAEGQKNATVWISVIFALGLFVALPQGLTAGLSSLLGQTFGVQTVAFHAITGGFKLLVFTAYISLIGLLPDMRRVFQYHGAEHKTIYAYEAGLPLDVDHVDTQSTLHPRCGTTFLVIVILVSIVVGAVVTPLLLPDVEGVLAHLLTLVLRILLLPVIAAGSYELQRVLARFCTQGPLQVLLWPGFLFQKITTRAPTRDQIEVAIAAMQAARECELRAAESSPEEQLRIFPDFNVLTQSLTRDRA